MTKLRSTAFVLLAIAVMALVVTGCKMKKAPQYPQETRHVMGTDVTITVYDPGLTMATLKPTFDDLFKLMADWEKKVLLPGADNQIAKINASAGEKSVSSEPPVFDMLMSAIRLYDNSGKVFDIRYGPMLDAWGFDGTPRVPAPSELDTLKTLVESGGMFVAGNSILLARKGMKFDTREIALGTIFDITAAKLAERGIRSAVIASPRVCRTMGDPPDQRGFPMKISNPVQADAAWGELHIPVGGTAYASASIGRFAANGKNYHALLDPRSGLPADRCAGAIVQAPDAATAQALSYAVFVFGTTDSLDANGKKEIGGSIVITDDGGKFNHRDTGSLSGKFESVR